MARRCAVTNVLPTSVPVPKTTTSRRGLANGGRKQRQLGECAAHGIDVLVGVGRRHRNAQPARPRRDGGRTDGRYEQASRPQGGGRGEGGLLGTKQYRDDGRRMS